MIFLRRVVFILSETDNKRRELQLQRENKEFGYTFFSMQWKHNESV